MNAITTHKTGTRLAARLDLLKAEKELTRRSDELARQRQELPWIRIDKQYRFETEAGFASLAGLLRGRSLANCSSTISCSGPITRRAVRPVLRLRTVSTESPCTYPTMT